MKFLRVLLACGKFYIRNTHFTTPIIDKPTGHQRHVIEQHPKIQLIPLLNRYSSQIPTDSSGKARRKRIVYWYMLMNNPIRLLAPLWVTNPFPTWPSTYPFSDKASPYSLLCIRQITNVSWGAWRAELDATWAAWGAWRAELDATWAALLRLRSYYLTHSWGLDWWVPGHVHMLVGHDHCTSGAPTCSEIPNRFCLEPQGPVSMSHRVEVPLESWWRRGCILTEGGLCTSAPLLPWG
jgi:hypothetical protein